MQPAPTDNARAAQRRTTLKTGRILFPNHRSTMDCTLRNVSATGAKLLVGSIVGVPDEFELMVSDGSRFNCRVVWRKMRELGVQFVQPEGASS